MSQWNPESWHDLINVSDQITYQAAYLSIELSGKACNDAFPENVHEILDEMDRLVQLARHHAELMRG